MLQSFKNSKDATDNFNLNYIISLTNFELIDFTTQENSYHETKFNANKFCWKKTSYAVALGRTGSEHSLKNPGSTTYLTKL